MHSRNAQFGQPLQPYEFRMAYLVAMGRDVRSAAHQCLVHYESGKKYLARAYIKLGVCTNIELAKWFETQDI